LYLYALCQIALNKSIIREHNFPAVLQRAGKNGGGWGEEIFAREQKLRPAPPPARLKQNTTEKFCFPFRRKIGRAQNQNRKQNFSLVGRALASGGGAASIGQRFLIK